MTFKGWLLIIALGLTGLQAWSQIENVDPTIRIVGGEAFYIHTAMRGQTIEQIAEAYFARPADVRNNNPGLNDPLAEGLKIRIPYSDASLEAMSKAETSDFGKPNEPKFIKNDPEEEEVEPVTPMEEAVALLDEPEEQDQDAEAMQALDDLNALSQSIKESLANLERIQEELEGPAEVSVLDTLRPENAKLVSRFMHEKHREYFDTSTSYVYTLKEFFMADVNPEGIIFTARDERTQTNENTRKWDLEEVHFLRIDDIEGEPDMAIGFVEGAIRYTYAVKAKNGEAKYELQSPRVSEFGADHPHAMLMRKRVKEEDLSGTGTIFIIEGHREINVYEQFEYNPFGTLKETVYSEKVLYIEKMEF